MTKQNENVDKAKQAAEEAQSVARDYINTFGINTQYPVAKFFARVLGVLSLFFMILGVFSLLKGLFDGSDSLFGSSPAALRFGPGLAMLFLGALGAAIASAIDILRDNTDRLIRANTP